MFLCKLLIFCIYKSYVIFYPNCDFYIHVHRFNKDSLQIITSAFIKSCRKFYLYLIIKNRLYNFSKNVIINNFLGQLCIIEKLS